LFCSFATAGVVLLENGPQTVGEGVGGTDAQPREASSQAEFRPTERRDRTQEVAGSSPASSMRNRRKLAVFFVDRAPVYVPGHSGPRWPQMALQTLRSRALIARGDLLPPTGMLGNVAGQKASFPSGPSPEFSLAFAPTCGCKPHLLRRAGRTKDRRLLSRCSAKSSTEFVS
jgi:hypothetical protein